METAGTPGWGIAAYTTNSWRFWSRLGQFPSGLSQSQPQAARFLGPGRLAAAFVCSTAENGAEDGRRVVELPPLGAPYSAPLRTRCSICWTFALLRLTSSSSQTLAVSAFRCSPLIVVDLLPAAPALAFFIFPSPKLVQPYTNDRSHTPL